MLEWFKAIFSNWGLAKDAIEKPAETGGDVAQSIIEKLNPALQRIVVLVLIIIALVMGANIGIEYERQQITSTPPAVIEVVPPTLEPVPVNPNLPRAEPIKAIEVWKPELTPLTLPEAKPVTTRRSRAVQASSKVGTQNHAFQKTTPVRRSASRRKHVSRRDYTYSIYQPPVMRWMATSGPGGY
jgi:hypothetical protein